MCTISILPVFEDGIEILHAAHCKQPHGVDHSGDASSDERASGEAEQEDLIPCLIVVHEEGICLANVLRKNLATDSSSPDLLKITSGRHHSRLVVYDLLHAVGAFG